MRSCAHSKIPWHPACKKMAASITSCVYTRRPRWRCDLYVVRRGWLMAPFIEKVLAYPGRHRGSIAVAICAGSALYGALSLSRGSHPSQVAFFTWIIWGQTGEWLKGQHWLFDRSSSRMMHKTMGEIYLEAKSGRLQTQLPVISPVAQVIDRGAVLLCFTSIVCFFWS